MGDAGCEPRVATAQSQFLQTAWSLLQSPGARDAASTSSAGSGSAGAAALSPPLPRMPAAQQSSWARLGETPA